MVKEGCSFEEVGVNTQFFLSPAPNRSPWKAVEDLIISCSPKKDPGKPDLFFSVQYYRTTSVVSTTLRLTSSILSIVYGNHVVRFRFLSSDCFLINMISPLKVCEHSNRFYLVPRKRKKDTTRSTTQRKNISFRLLCKPIM